MMEHCEQTEESLARPRGPIDIYIGRRTSPEIAVSVMAEILAVKNGVILPIAAQVGPAKIIRDAAPVSRQGGACERFWPLECIGSAATAPLWKPSRAFDDGQKVYIQLTCQPRKHSVAPTSRGREGIAPIKFGAL